MPKILIVDDEPDTVELISIILGKKGYEVAKAYSGKECLEAFRKEKPDLILLDIMMPGMSGWDVYGRIRKLDKKVKVAFVSVIEVSPERLQVLKKDGVSDYITKPFTADNLLKRVGSII